MKVNTENSNQERLQLLLGIALSLAGVVVLIVVGAFYGYSNIAVWIGGSLLVISGIFIAASHRLSQLLTDILKM